MKQKHTKRLCREWRFDHSAFARAVEARIHARKLTLRDAADEIGIGLSSVWRVSRHVPAMAVIVRICQWLGVTVDSFVRK